MAVKLNSATIPPNTNHSGYTKVRIVCKAWYASEICGGWLTMNYDSFNKSSSAILNFPTFASFWPYTNGTVQLRTTLIFQPFSKTATYLSEIW